MIAAFLCAPARAMDQSALVAQTASVLASIDYARAKCPRLSINDAALTKLIARTRKSIDALRADEDYEDQKNALRHVESQQGAVMVCFVLPSAHGGVARGLIGKR